MYIFLIFQTRASVSHIVRNCHDITTIADPLIICVFSITVLYDVGHKHYKDKRLNDKVWSRIAEQLGHQDIKWLS